MSKTTNCRSCGEEIAFEKNKNDRWAPVDPMSRQRHVCQIERVCEDCQKTFKGADWMKVCGDCYRGRGSSPGSPPEPASEPRKTEPLQDDMRFDDDAPPF
jgi:hypothetical protein